MSRFEARGPKYEHHVKDDVFLGSYNGYDLYFHKELQSGLEGWRRVLARSGPGDQYFHGMCSCRPLNKLKSEPERVLRVAFLIAADKGLIPFEWGGSIEMSPKNCEGEA